MTFFRNLTSLLTTFQVTDLIDILVISVIVYYIILLVKETRAEQLIKGFIVILVFAQLSEALNLYTVHWVLSNLMTVVVILIIVVFQPELRRAFERLGRSRGWLLNFANNEDKKTESRIEEIVRACMSLSRQKIGALIVLEGNTGLNDIIESGTEIDGYVTAELLINIFIPNTPLHDGAVVIRNDKVLAAGVFLPLTQNINLDRELGTRHRAALGISERSDALVVVVSEETGLISICSNGEIVRHLDEQTLRDMLNDFFTADQPLNFLDRFFGSFKKGGSHGDTQA
ncbi:MAG: diadenylate cyclase CdaA [Peptoniphilaceae bacterium]|nr:diadenylate cyclase CdaA [Peptoniphilaceae bacterium]MCI6659865.1 diadenylate cyclase CdaA [Peptoniphilaceae bacterium]MDD7434175.1 diadenylate cyclase CdaA [Peptoniphilaceae bacterium]MDY3075271.1 diadenylate cyclase CdaA [Peptoniphilaceae bacterium]MDY3987095.1 diadenylate cyclase CdaA [Peptoniphilaceae bacterium]